MNFVSFVGTDDERRDGWTKTSCKVENTQLGCDRHGLTLSLICGRDVSTPLF